MTQANAERHGEIRDAVLERIREGTYTGRLPTEQALAEEFGVNFKTAAKALRRLAEEGVISRQRGRGSFVREDRAPAVPGAVHMLPLEENALQEDNPYRAYVTRFVEGLWAAASARNLAVSLLPGGGGRALMPRPGSVVVVLGPRTPETIRDLLEKGYRPLLVGLDRERSVVYRAMPFLAISQDMENTYRLLVEHLRKRGCRRIALLHRSRPPFRDRRELFVRAIARAGLPFLPELAIRWTDGDEDGRGVAEELLAAGMPFDGLVAPYNGIARRVLDALAAAGGGLPPEHTAVEVEHGAAETAGGRVAHVCWNLETVAAEAVRLICENDYVPGTRYLPAKLVTGDY